MDKLSQRRLVENEMIFRQLNEQPIIQLAELNSMAEEEGSEPYSLETSEPFHFYCECSDENCRQRIEMNVGDYTEIHKHRNNFIVITGHEVAEVEEVISKKPDYSIVRKFQKPPDVTSELHITPVHNI